jgi:hypothetical protein
MVQGYKGSRKIVETFPFVGANLTNVGGTLTFPGTLGSTSFWLHRRGSVIGFSGSLNAAMTTGTLTFQPVINGSLAPVFSDARFHVSSQANYQTLDANTDNYIFTAGQSLGLSYTSSDTVAPLTVDGIFIIEVLLEEAHY